ncbi:DUF6482 family protein [Motiliproteus sediminis]|uniref:DUF6482 family protein n=1 Tax=Motiliproteus sediminis TaxID=1468178 RepID=UPI001AEFE0D4|nr:DUF6482 family protein [Motiliproteus sediminis]
MDVKTFGQEVQNGRVEAVNILSNEGDIYTASALIRGKEHTLENDDSRQPLVFHSYIEAKRRFEDYRVPLTLKQSEVYDEMVSGVTRQH